MGLGICGSNQAILNGMLHFAGAVKGLKLPQHSFWQSKALLGLVHKSG